MSAQPRPPADTPQAWHHALETSDLDELAQAQPEWQLRYQQLSPGTFRGAMQHLQLPGLRLVREQVSQAVRQQGHLGQGHYGFAMMPGLQGEAIFNGQRLDAQAIMLGRSDDLDRNELLNWSLLNRSITKERDGLRARLDEIDEHFRSIGFALVATPDIVPLTSMHLVVEADGLTRVVEGRVPNARVALTAEPAAFLQYVTARLSR